MIDKKVSFKSMLDICSLENNNKNDDVNSNIYRAIIKDTEVLSIDYIGGYNIRGIDSEYETKVVKESNKYIDINHPNRIIDGYTINNDGHIYKIKSLYKLKSNEKVKRK